VNILRSRFKLGVIALICGGAIACTCGALDVDFSRRARGLLQAVGFQGSARAGRLAPEVIVDAGNELTISRGRQTLNPISPDEVGKRLAWAGMYQKDGWLSFRGQSLADVVAEFNRHNTRKLIIADPQTARLQVGGKFKAHDLDGFVAALGFTHGVRATVSGGGGREGDVITLSGGNPSGSAQGPQRGVPPQEP
jgi:ferric-dicitrate binding protein FerR (iron transport regulator)